MSYHNGHGEILHNTPLREVFNLRCYIQHLMDESEDETQNPFSEENWMKQNNWKFIKYKNEDEAENLSVKKIGSNRLIGNSPSMSFITDIL